MRQWTCRSCRSVWPRTKQKCACGKARPKGRAPAHRLVLSEPYEEWETRFGPACGICGASASARRRLDRDHDHRTGTARGLLCNRCNRALPNHVDIAWLKRAVMYLERSA